MTSTNARGHTRILSYENNVSRVCLFGTSREPRNSASLNASKIKARLKGEKYILIRARIISNFVRSRWILRSTMCVCIMYACDEATRGWSGKCLLSLRPRAYLRGSRRVNVFARKTNDLRSPRALRRRCLAEISSFSRPSAAAWLAGTRASCALLLSLRCVSVNACLMQRFSWSFWIGSEDSCQFDGVEKLLWIRKYILNGSILMRRI